MKKAVFIIMIISAFVFFSCGTKKNTVVFKNSFISDNTNRYSIPIMEPDTYSTAYVVNDFCKIFKKPALDSEIAGEVYYRRELKIIAKMEDFYSINFDDGLAFVRCSDVDFNVPAEREFSFSNLSAKGEAFIDDVPMISQFPDFPTGCEAVSTVMALNFLGEEITVSEFIDNYLPISNSFYFKNGELYGPNPNKVYVGDPRTERSFGCMSAAIEKALLNYIDDKSRIKRYEGVALENLCAKYIDHDIPVLIWVTIAMIPSYDSAEWKTDENETYVWPANEHCMLMVGYDNYYYYMNDCYKGKLIAYPKEKTETRYKELGCQAIVIEK